MTTPELKKTVLWTLGTYFMILASLYYYSYKTNRFYAPQPHKISKCEQRLRAYIGDDYIASVIARSRYPFTLAAIAKVESDFRPQIKGDSGKSHGLYQIQSQHWGSFDKSVEGQTRKAEQVFSELVREYGYKTAIERWNGSGKQARQYRQKVLLTMAQI